MLVYINNSARYYNRGTIYTNFAINVGWRHLGSQAAQQFKALVTEARLSTQHLRQVLWEIQIWQSTVVRKFAVRGILKH